MILKDYCLSYRKQVSVETESVETNIAIIKARDEELESSELGSSVWVPLP